MNRRPVLIALAVVVPLALFVPAKIAASWRPVKVGHIPSVTTMGPTPMTMRASSRYLVASDAIRTDRFDLRDGGQSVVIHGGIAENDDWMANLRAPKPDQMELSLHRDARTFAYPIENVTTFGKTGFDARTTAQLLSRRTLRIHTDRVELVYLNAYYRWDRASRKLQRKTYLDGMNSLLGRSRQEEIAALSRDGERVVTLGARVIEWRETRDGRIIKRFDLSGYPPSNQISGQMQLSDYGQLALYNVRDTRGDNSPQWNVRDTESGRIGWEFVLPSTDHRAAISSDETQLAVPTANSGWQIRDAQTGAIIRTLPLVPGTTIAAFSPDNSTLYSVANGTLYRQRAR